MKEELLKSLAELNGLIFRGLREDNPDKKMISAMHIALRLGHIKMTVEKLNDSCFYAVKPEYSEVTATT